MVHRFLLEDDAAAVAKLLFVRLTTKGLKIVVCLSVGEEESRRKNSPWMRTRGRHARQ
jgi:hypothetical protein